MLKRNLWKLILSLGVVLWASLSLFPIQDRDFPVYVRGEAKARSEEFGKLLDEAKARFDDKSTKTPSVFVGLRDIANERKIDLADAYFPQIRLESSLRNITKRNNLLLDHLLKQSKGHLQLGLDLRGGVAFTLEVDEKAAAQVSERDRTEKLSKAIEIIGDRINGLGVAEPIVRPVGANRIEVQLAGVNTRDNPEVLEAVKKPARLDFRLVYPFASPGRGDASEVPPLYEIKSMDREGSNGQTVTEELYVKRTPEMTGEGVDSAYPSVDEFGRYRIMLRFNSEGSKKFAAVTAEVARQTQDLRTKTNNPRISAQLAIILDGKVCSAPGVQEEIAGGSAVITGQFTRREAEDLANVLNNPLDLPLVVREQYEVGPSLAQDAIDSGVRAAVIGTALVAGFMVTYYTVGGGIALIALGFNVLIVFATMASLGATLTLPGLAGIVLTLGMAVDANILIFERMRDELGMGKSLVSAHHAGYDRAFTTILDAHITQLAICAVMIGLGTGPIKGFGVTLAIGVFSTLFSVLIVGHLILDWLITGGIIKKLPMMKPITIGAVDFVKLGKPSFIISWAIVLASVVFVFFKGDKIYGVDFLGGDIATLTFEKRIDSSEIRKIAESVGIAETTPTYVAPIGGGTETLRIETPFNQSPALVQALQKAHPEAGLKQIGTNSIGPSIGGEVRTNALISLALSMVIILIYVALRFEWGFGVGAVVASIHDILMTIGIFVLFGHQFSAPMVAAILAIAGYSINDTVVVFDRIREEMKNNPNGNLRDIINLSLRRVFSRSILTSVTVLLTAIALFVAGTGVMRDLAFTFIIGIITGAFSSVFIASPVFYWWHKGDRGKVDDDEKRKVYDWEVQTKASR
ncbi:protein-export membrane protein SecD [Verrucomicrobia bacterium IMCC26134]|nr:protein-export membrane protein SecD [Verrucomicrobia bacterium IMCC26134]